MRILSKLFALTLIAGCTSLPSTEKTTPTLSWTVENLTTHETNTAEKSGGMSGHAGDEFRVTLAAKDAGGIHHLQWHASTDFTCSQGDIVTHVNDAGVSFEAHDTFEPNPAGEVLTFVPFTRTLTLTSTTCPSLTTFDGGNTAILASATNHAGVVTKGVFNIGIAP
jgi:hypothetical protein